MELYRYNSLRNGEDIRLLRIKDTVTSTDTVVCTLQHRKTDDLPDAMYSRNIQRKGHDALSYTWGPTFADGSHLTDLILCDGRPFLVTATLNQCLKRHHKVRHEDISDRRYVGLLWVDVICINQADDQEKSQLVGRMDAVYQHCACTIIWLGEPWSVEAKEAIAGIANLFAEHPSQTLSTLALNPLFDRHRLVWKRLLHREWFERRWVVQEYVLSEKRVFLIGNNGIDSDAHYDFMRVEKASPRDHVAHEFFEAVHSGVNVVAGILLDQLTTFVFTKYKEPLDSVYAFLGDALDRHAITVDYTVFVMEMNLQVASVYIAQADLLLPFLPSSFMQKRSADYPSWLPD
jgi:hypothetical protein